jgi:hypothetical protein
MNKILNPQYMSDGFGFVSHSENFSLNVADNSVLCASQPSLLAHKLNHSQA